MRNMTVIIGGGVAGLTAGIYGQLSGLDCTVIEKNAVVGGNLTAWKRQGCVIDNCMHWLNGTRPGSSLNEMWRTVGMLGKGVELYKKPAFYTSEYQNKSISLWRDTRRTLKEMTALSKQDYIESRGFINAVEAVARAEYGTLIDKAEYLPVIIKYGNVSLAELGKRFSHPLLQKLMTDYLPGEFSAMALIYSYASFAAGDADVTVGGSKEAADRIAARFVALGGKIFTGCEASQIAVKEKRAVGVTLSDGRFVRADNVICACDPQVTFGKLLPERYMPRKMRETYQNTHETPTYSAVHAAFVCDDDKSLPKDTTVFEMSAIKFDGRAVNRIIIKPYRANLVDVPEGKVVLQTIFFLEEPEAVRWIKLAQNRERYREIKQKFASAVRERIIKRYPKAKKSIKLLDVWTPSTYKRYFDTPKGAFLSFELRPGKALTYRVGATVKGLENVFLATQWQNAPGGLPVAAQNGKKAANAAKAAAMLPNLKSTYAFRIRHRVKEI